MRIIDADALLKALEEDMKYGGVKTDEFDKGYDLGIKAAIEMLDNAPTVEPQDKWGKWVISEIRCPNCLEYFQTDCYSMEELKKCPNCGASMKGSADMKGSDIQ